MKVRFCLALPVCVVFSLVLGGCFLKKSAPAEYVSPDSNEYTLLKQAAADDKELTFWSNYPHNILADELVTRMSDSELLAQMYMFGWAGLMPSDAVISWVEERGIGSVKIFGWNTDDVHQVAQSVILLQEKAQNRPFKIPLYVATDQEGGWIRHVKGETSDTPGNLAIGASGYPSDAYYSGFYIGREMRALGINMNFAPTVDVYSNIDSTVIGPRSFGANPEHVGVLGAAFSAGSLAAGVLSTAKHFPGHGDTSLDSHGRLPLINISRKTLDERELVPFKYLAAEKIPAIMSGHLAFPQITGNGEPASLSKTFLTDMLRNEIGYEGLIITDDMMMNGASTYAGSVSNAFRMAIEAGNDILCSSKTAPLNDPLWRNNLTLMQTSAEFRHIVISAARRILLSKLNYFKSPKAVPLFPDLKKIDESLPDPEGKTFFLEQACRSVTVYKQGEFPYRPETAGRVLIASAFPQFAEEGKKRYPKADAFYFKYLIPAEDFDQTAQNLRAAARNADTVIIYVLNPDSARLAQNLRATGKRVIVVSGLTPVYVLKNFEWAQSVLLIYSYSPYSFEAAFAALCGDFTPQGILPLSEAR